MVAPPCPALGGEACSLSLWVERVDQKNTARECFFFLLPPHTCAQPVSTLPSPPPQHYAPLRPRLPRPARPGVACARSGQHVRLGPRVSGERRKGERRRSHFSLSPPWGSRACPCRRPASPDLGLTRSLMLPHPLHTPPLSSCSKINLGGDTVEETVTADAKECCDRCASKPDYGCMG